MSLVISPLGPREAEFHYGDRAVVQTVASQASHGRVGVVVNIYDEAHNMTEPRRQRRGVTVCVFIHPILSGPGDGTVRMNVSRRIEECDLISRKQRRRGT